MTTYAYGQVNLCKVLFMTVRLKQDSLRRLFFAKAVAIRQPAINLHNLRNSSSMTPFQGHHLANFKSRVAAVDG